MKPIRLEMRGINSFQETQSVDFLRLTERGIFGIFGPTGSGKSTILDAMTLALYNETARKSREYINSDGKELFVTLEFEVGTLAGRAVYIVERGKKREKDGSIKSTINRLYRKDGSGEILERSGRVNKAIVDLLGLTMEDFTRSVVIPQGKFSDFLKLTGSNRKKMLERILRLQEFGELLTGRVKRMKEENEMQLYGVKESLEAYSKLEIDKLEEFKNKLQASQSRLVDLTTKENEMRKQLESSSEFWSKKDSLASIEKMIELSKSKDKEMEALKNRFETAKKVKEMGPYVKEKREANEEMASIIIFIEKTKADLKNMLESKLKLEDRFKEAVSKREENYEGLLGKSIEMRHLMENEIKRMKEIEKGLKKEEETIEKYLQEMNSVRDSVEKREIGMGKLIRELNEKAQTLDALKHEHLVLSIGKKLLIGDSCPICGSEIKEFAFMKRDESDQAKVMMDKLEGEMKTLKKAFEDQEKKNTKERELALKLEYDKEALNKLHKSHLEEEGKLLSRVDEVFKGRDPEVVVKDLKLEMKELLENEKNASQNLNIINEEISGVRESLNESVRAFERNKERLRIASKSLEKEMEKAGMMEEDEIAGFIIADAELQSMETRYQAWKMQNIKLNVQRDDILHTLSRINNFGNRNDFEKLKADFKIVQSEKEEIHENHIRLKERIEQMERNLETVIGLEKKKKKLEKDSDLLKEIMELLRGNAFVGFVAMRHLRYIVKDASVRLLDITGGRYRLEIDSQGEFVICDHFSGGARRGCDTLSGGETFIVSLALALALSAKIQMNRVNNLEFFFLDEGFGTLDKDVLDIVMDSLERIREKNLSVGLISHVEALKDRVPVKLVIEPAEPGISGSVIKMEYM